MIPLVVGNPQVTGFFLIVVFKRGLQAFAGLITVWLMTMRLPIIDQFWNYFCLNLSVCATFIGLSISFFFSLMSFCIAVFLDSGQDAIEVQQLRIHLTESIGWVRFGFRMSDDVFALEDYFYDMSIFQLKIFFAIMFAAFCIYIFLFFSLE